MNALDYTARECWNQSQGQGSGFDCPSSLNFSLISGLNSNRVIEKEVNINKHRTIYKENSQSACFVPKGIESRHLETWVTSFSSETSDLCFGKDQDKCPSIMWTTEFHVTVMQEVGESSSCRTWIKLALCFPGSKENNMKKG